MIADSVEFNSNNDIVITNNYKHLISSDEKQNASPPIMISIPAQVSYQWHCIRIYFKIVHFILKITQNISLSSIKHVHKQRGNICKL